MKRGYERLDLDLIITRIGGPADKIENYVQEKVTDIPDDNIVEIARAQRKLIIVLSRRKWGQKQNWEKVFSQMVKELEKKGYRRFKNIYAHVYAVSNSYNNIREALIKNLKGMGNLQWYSSVSDQHRKSEEEILEIVKTEIEGGTSSQSAGEKHQEPYTYLDVFLALGEEIAGKLEKKRERELANELKKVLRQVQDKLREIDDAK